MCVCVLDGGVQCRLVSLFWHIVTVSTQYDADMLSTIYKQHKNRSACVKSNLQSQLSELQLHAEKQTQHLKKH